MSSFLQSRYNLAWTKVVTALDPGLGRHNQSLRPV